MKQCLLVTLRVYSLLTTHVTRVKKLFLLPCFGTMKGWKCPVFHKINAGKEQQKHIIFLLSYHINHPQMYPVSPYVPVNRWSTFFKSGLAVYTKTVDNHSNRASALSVDLFLNEPNKGLNWRQTFKNGRPNYTFFFVQNLYSPEQKFYPAQLKTYACFFL